MPYNVEMLAIAAVTRTAPEGQFTVIAKKIQEIRSVLYPDVIEVSAVVGVIEEINKLQKLLRKQPENTHFRIETKSKLTWQLDRLRALASLLDYEIKNIPSVNQNNLAASCLNNKKYPACFEVPSRWNHLLPTEILFSIGGYLSLPDIIRCAKVSSRWRAVFSEIPLWNKLIFLSADKKYALKVVSLITQLKYAPTLREVAQAYEKNVKDRFSFFGLFKDENYNKVPNYLVKSMIERRSEKQLSP